MWHGRPCLSALPQAPGLTPTPPSPSFTWAKLNRLVNRWSHSADAAIIKHLDFYLWFIFLERYISYGALVWTYVAPTPLLLFCQNCASLRKVARFPGEHQILWFPASANHQSRHLAADAGCLAISSSFPPPAPTQASREVQKWFQVNRIFKKWSSESKQRLVCLDAAYVSLVCSLKVLMCVCSIIRLKHSFKADARLFYTPQSDSTSNNAIWSQSLTQLFHYDV